MVFNGQLQVFYNGGSGTTIFLSSLRHAWWNGAFWSAETLDGPGSGWSGHGQIPADGMSGADTPQSAIAYSAQLDIFYTDATLGALRHSWWAGGSWSAQTLDS